MSKLVIKEELVFWKFNLCSILLLLFDLYRHTGKSTSVIIAT